MKYGIQRWYNTSICNFCEGSKVEIAIQALMLSEAVLLFEFLWMKLKNTKTNMSLTN